MVTKGGKTLIITFLRRVLLGNLRKIFFFFWRLVRVETKPLIDPKRKEKVCSLAGALFLFVCLFLLAFFWSWKLKQIKWKVQFSQNILPQLSKSFNAFFFCSILMRINVWAHRKNKDHGVNNDEDDDGSNNEDDDDDDYDLSGWCWWW